MGCKSNRICDEDIMRQIQAFCAALGCRGAFICSDDYLLKQMLTTTLPSVGLRVATFDALLSTDGIASHKDTRLNRRENARDVLVEALLMSRCGYLLSTWSNVSVATVFFSPPSLEFFMFGDDPPVTRQRTLSIDETSGAFMCQTCRTWSAPFLCSRCRSAY